MRNIYLYMFIGIIAIVMTVVSFMNFDPKVETWSSFFAGATVAILIIRSPTIISWFKNQKAK